MTIPGTDKMNYSDVPVWNLSAIYIPLQALISPFGNQAETASNFNGLP